MSPSDLKIVGIYRLKNEERWISKSIESLKGICSEIVVLDESTDSTLDILKTFDEVVDVYHQENMEFDEVRDRNKLLSMALARNPDYIFSLDGDEVLSPNSQNILLKEINDHKETNVFEFQSLFIWDKPNQFRYDGIFKVTWQKRLLKINHQPSDLSFSKTNYPYNLHSGHLPHNAIGFDTPYQSRVLILHYGNYDNHLREKKFNLYSTMDPNNTSFDGYKHIIGDDNALSGSNGMELKILPEGMYYPDIDTSKSSEDVMKYKKINTDQKPDLNNSDDYDTNPSTDIFSYEFHISGLKSYFEQILKEKNETIQNKDTYIEQIIKDKDTYIEQIIKDYESQLSDFKKSKILNLLRKLDSIRHR